MSNELTPSPGDGVIAHFINHWFGGLHLPGAVKAISRLVVGVASIPSAGAEWAAARIEDDNYRRSQAARLIADAASRAGKEDLEFAQRALSYQTESLFLKQANREAVAIKTIEHIKEEPPCGAQDDGPSDDFMNLFADQSERASTEEMRDLFARVLAGEIRKPGSFSLRTLQFLGLVDMQLAGLISKVRGWSSQGRIIITSTMSKGMGLLEMGELEDVGLLRGGLYIEVRHSGSSIAPTPLIFENEVMCLHWKDNAPGFSLPCYYLTTVGREVMSLLPFIKDEAYTDAALQAVIEEGCSSLRKITWATLNPPLETDPPGSICWTADRTLWENPDIGSA